VSLQLANLFFLSHFIPGSFTNISIPWDLFRISRNDF
jgi:hypothetical protein